MSNTIKIILVDDHILFRDGLKYVISRIPDCEIIAEASNGKEFLEMLESVSPDLALMDISMPEMNGIEATKAGLKKDPDLKVITLSMYGDRQYYYEMIDAGAKGFILKESGKNELEKAITEVASGGNYFSQELLTKIISNFNEDQKPHANTDIMAQLTEREYEVLKLVCNGLSNTEISKKLFLSVKTVEGHKTKLLQKTETKNSAGLIIYAIKNGLISI